MTDFGAWPDCAVPGCDKRACLRLDSKYCWAHTPGVMTDEVAEALREGDAESALQRNGADFV